jgi:hypothetical protein
MTDKAEIPQAVPETQSGRIRLPRFRAWFGMLFGLLMLAVALWATIVNSNGDVAAAMAFPGVVFTGAAAPQVVWDHEVRWNQKGIEGPAKMFGLTLGAARTEIAWSEIVKMGRAKTRYWYVEAGNGRRVYWSYLSVGYEALTRALKGHCPTLRLDFHLSE